MKTFIGIDGGASGALAAIFPDLTWEAQPVLLCDTEETMLDVHGNLRLVEAIAAKAGGVDRIEVVYERCRKNPMFGTKNNFANGRHDEFWRVLLAARGIPCSAVFPRTWQDACLGRGGPVHTKERALSFIQSRCRDLGWLSNFNKPQRQGIIDAMCIALWSKDAQAALQALTAA